MSSAEENQTQAGAQTQALVYPQFVLDKLSEISRLSNVKIDSLKEEYESTFQDPYIQNDPQFKSDEERHSYASARIWSRYAGRPPLFEVKVIPVGIEGKRISKKGKGYASLFVLIMNPSKKQLELKRVSFLENTVDQLSGINFLNGYTVKLGKFKGTEDYTADTRSKWENPTTISKTATELLTPFNFKQVAIANTVNFPSRKLSNGFTDSLDWRRVRAMIWRKNDGVRKDGTEFALYTVGDLETGRQDIVGKDGSVIPAGFTVWVDKLMHGFNEEDECDFFGTITVDDKTGAASMNSYLVLPVHVNPQRKQ